MDLDQANLSMFIRENSAWIPKLRNEIAKAIVGQKYMIDRMLVGLLTGGHLLLEGLPGLGKTLAVKSLAQAISGEFKRIQFTPDMLPADVTGVQIFDARKGEFVLKKGPIFANIILADEINRAPAKVQSALLESMQEHQVTVDGCSSPLPDLFLVLATENPIEQEGTYPLPESQIDRFLLKLRIEYPSKLEEMKILQSSAGVKTILNVENVVSIAEILRARELIDEIFIDPRVQEYIVNIVLATRKPSDYHIDFDRFVAFGCSPRGTVALALAAKAWAFLQGRGFVTPQDVKAIGLDVLRHRIVTTYLADAEGISSEVVAARILNTVKVP